MAKLEATLVLVVFALRLEDGGHIAHAADVLQVGERAINAVQEHEIARVIHQTAHPGPSTVLAVVSLSTKSRCCGTAARSRARRCSRNFGNLDQTTPRRPKRKTASPGRWRTNCRAARTLPMGLRRDDRRDPASNMSQRNRAETPAAARKVKRFVDAREAPALEQPQPAAVLNVFLPPAQAIPRPAAPPPTTARRAGGWRPAEARLDKQAAGAGIGVGVRVRVRVGRSWNRIHKVENRVWARLIHIVAASVSAHHDCFHNRPQPGGDQAKAHQLSGHAQEQLQHALSTTVAHKNYARRKSRRRPPAEQRPDGNAGGPRAPRLGPGSRQARRESRKP
jgi:hypothetical protein